MYSLSRSFSFPLSRVLATGRRSRQCPGPYPSPSGLCQRYCSFGSVVRGSFPLLRGFLASLTISYGQRQEHTPFPRRLRSCSVPQGQPDTGHDAADHSTLTVALHCLWTSVQVETQPRRAVYHPPTTAAVITLCPALVFRAPSFRRAPSVWLPRGGVRVLYQLPGSI